jgi:hypothetical protein
MINRRISNRVTGSVFDALIDIERRAESDPKAVSSEDAELVAIFWQYIVSRLIKSKNPLVRWIQYHLAREIGEPIPEHVLQYLDEVAKHITNVLIAETSRNPDAALAAALGLAKNGKGRGHPLNECWHYKRDFGIYVDCRARMQVLKAKHGKRVDRAAFQEVAHQYGMSPAQVRRIYMAQRGRWPKATAETAASTAP